MTKPPCPHVHRLALLPVLLVLATVACRDQDTTAESPLSVCTESGVVRGVVEEGVRVFRGIPYATPPVGPLRWRPPRPPAPWEGTFTARTFGPACPQSGTREPTDEDCLTLNIWTPADASPASRRPVMVWIHGGAFRSGAGSDPTTPGHAFARDGVVLVTFNYRLGALGFFAHPLLEAAYGDEPRANYGILDMVAVLEWVKRNIGAFGGDPSQVTVFGESAGGMAVQLLMTVPRAEGLFQRAIAMSGYGTWPLPRLRAAPSRIAPPGAPTAEDVGESIIARAVPPDTEVDTLAELRAIPGSRLGEAVEPLHLPLVDGVVVPDEPGVLFARGEQHDVPFMTGGDSYDGAVMPWTGVSVPDFLASWGRHQREVRALYADDFALSDQLGASRLFGDARYLIAARYLAANMSRVSSAGYLYYFGFVPETLRSTAPGAPHASENGPLFARVADAESQQVGRTMRAYWINFARSGNPNGPGLPEWPAYEASTDRWLVIDVEPRAQTGVVTDRLDFLERRYLERVGGL